MAIYPGQKKVIFNTSVMESMPNIMGKLVPEDRQYENVVQVYDVKEKKLILLSDIVAQEMLCFFS